MCEEFLQHVMRFPKGLDSLPKSSLAPAVIPDQMHNRRSFQWEKTREAQFQESGHIPVPSAWVISHVPITSPNHDRYRYMVYFMATIRWCPIGLLPPDIRALLTWHGLPMAWDFFGAGPSGLSQRILGTWEHGKLEFQLMLAASEKLEHKYPIEIYIYIILYNYIYICVCVNAMLDLVHFACMMLHDVRRCPALQRPALHYSGLPRCHPNMASHAPWERRGKNGEIPWA